MTIARLPVRRSTTISPRSGIAVASIRWCDGVTVAGSISVEFALQRERRLCIAAVTLPSECLELPVEGRDAPVEVGQLGAGRHAEAVRERAPQPAEHVLGLPARFGGCVERADGQPRCRVARQRVVLSSYADH